MEGNHALTQYTDENGLAVEVGFQDENAWMTQKAIAELFGVGVPTINEHLKNIFETKELEEEATIRKIRIVRMEGDRRVTRNLDHYSLDAIISVGYRVNSKRATAFRIWATQVLGQLIKDGYVIDERRLREDPAKLSELAAKLRELRASEKNVFASVRECFKIAASDYDPSSAEVRQFYALLQDKFHHAVTGMTASKIVLDRADHSEPNMGLQTLEGVFPTLREAKVGKNYLRQEELYRLHLLSEQFLLYAESTALSGQAMTMAQLRDQLDTLLRLNGYPVFSNYEDYLKDRAMDHVQQEFDTFVEIEKLKMLGLEVDLGDYYLGEYEEYREQLNEITPHKLRKHLEKALEAPKE
ncbi:RhuM family protein [Alloalcanivorax xenomutans]|uniref:RhuM family protein n=1 Tax=Alloalcanivorax xenomutans TaxID=1094342 RepID=UPI003D9B3BF7